MAHKQSSARGSISATVICAGGLVLCSLLGAGCSVNNFGFTSHQRVLLTGGRLERRFYPGVHLGWRGDQIALNVGGLEELNWYANNPCDAINAADNRPHSNRLSDEISAVVHRVAWGANLRLRDVEPGFTLGVRASTFVALPQGSCWRNIDLDLVRPELSVICEGENACWE